MRFLKKLKIQLPYDPALNYSPHFLPVFLLPLKYGMSHRFTFHRCAEVMLNLHCVILNFAYTGFVANESR